MRSKTMIVLFGLLLLVVTSNLETTTYAQSEPSVTPSSYSALLDTEIRGISPEVIEGYRTGAGGGIALPAELNGYPGPRHVLDLSDALGLSDEKHDQIQELYDDMRPRAVGIGEQILAAEAALELAFREGNIDELLLEEQLAEIGSLQAYLRFVHLRTHIATVDILTADQVTQYNVLRGYGADTQQQGHSAH